MTAAGTLLALVVTVVDDRGVPVEGARVDVWTDSGIWRELYPDGAAHGAPRSLRTDREGRCEVSVDAPDYGLTLRVVADGWAPTEADGLSGSTSPRVVLLRGTTVSGTVLDEASGLRLPGALVQVLSPSVPTSPTLETRTDECGEFVLASLEPGAYRIAVRAADHAPRLTDVNVGDEPASLGDVALAPSLPLVLEVRTLDDVPVAGALVAIDTGEARKGSVAWTATGVDGSARIPAAPNGPLRFSVHHPELPPLVRAAVTPQVVDGVRYAPLRVEEGTFVAGRVVDLGGRPVTHATISLHGERPLTARSQDDGRFRIGGVTPGTGFASVRASGYHGAEATLEIPREGLTSLLVKLDPGRVLDGLVLGPTGRPVAGARVSIEPDYAAMEAELGRSGDRPAEPEVAVEDALPGPNEFVSTAEFNPGPAMTDASGMFRVSGLGAGAASVARAEAAGLAPGQSKAGPDAAWVEIHLPAGAMLTGRIVDAETGAAIVDGSVVLSATLPEGGLAGVASERAFAKPDGTFTIEGIPAGTYVPSASARGRGTVTWSPLTLRDGELLSGIELPLPRGATIAGVVVKDGTTSAVAGALVTCRGCADYPVADASDSEGRFRLEGIAFLPAGIEAQHTDYVGGDAVRVMLRPGEETSGVVVPMRALGVVCGRVTHRGRPVGGAIVTSLDQRAATSADGEYMLRLPAGIVSIEAEYLAEDDGGHVRREASVREKEPVVVDLELAGRTRLLGRVALGGKPVAQGYMLTEAAGVEVSPNGSFQMEAVHPGSLELEYEGGGNGLRAQWRIEVPDLAVHQVELEIPASGIRGNVVDADGAPVSDAVVRVEDGETTPAYAKTDESGAFELRGVSPGHRRIRAVAAGDSLPRSSVVEVDVLPGRVTEGVRIRLETESREHVIVGTVVAPDGTAVYEASVMAIVSSLIGAIELTDPSGRFRVERLPSGYATFAATTDGFSPAIVRGVAVGQATPPLDLRLSPEATITVRVTRGGMGVVGASVSCLYDWLPPEESQHFGTTGATDALGVANLRGIPLGRARLRVTTPLARREVPVTAVAGQVVEVSIDL